MDEKLALPSLMKKGKVGQHSICMTRQASKQSGLHANVLLRFKVKRET